jgi:hypothetical protein
MRSFLLPISGWLSCLIGIQLASDQVYGAPVTFEIDSARSRITVSGSVIGNTLQEQAPGSLTTSFSGLIKAELGESSLQFTGQSQLDAQTNGVWEPMPGGQAGTAAADYGALANTFLGEAKGAFRNLVLDMTSALLALRNGSFDSAALVFAFPEDTSAAFDYTTGFLGSGTRQLSGLSTNRIVNGATLVSTGGVQTLTIKIAAEFKFKAISDDDSVVQLTGQIVAASAALPVITSIIATNQGVTIRVEGAAGEQYRLQSSRDLINWSARDADVTAQSGHYIFSAKLLDNLEFFRISK